MHSLIKTLEWTEAGVVFVDQTKLPTEEVYATRTIYKEVAPAIKDMIVRGAPAIGVAAAMGIALGVRDSAVSTVPELRQVVGQVCRAMGETRPTAVNLFWAIRRMQRKFEELSNMPLAVVKKEMVLEAQRIHLEDIDRKS